MIASAIAPAPTRLSVDARSGLICGLYEAESQGQIALTAFMFHIAPKRTRLRLLSPGVDKSERMFAKLTQNCGRYQSDRGAELPPGRGAGRDRSLPPAAEGRSTAPRACRRAE